MHRARLYARHKGYVRCNLCSHYCKLSEGQRGICGVRLNHQGELYTLVYGQLVAEHIDPIEKKPLFHVLPGSTTLSISTKGCNFTCLHCQNASISQVRGSEDPARLIHSRSAQEIVENAVKADCSSISYTYVEPTVFFEFAMDCCEAAEARGIKNIFVSNGYMSREATDYLAPLLYGINIDCKSFSDDFYRDVCGARLKPVLNTIERMLAAGVWVEVTTLVIPGLNDSTRELRELAAYLAGLSPYIPWHVSAFYPAYKLTSPPPTPPATLDRARQIGFEAGLKFVYAGNRPGQGGEDTNCPGCGECLISRYGFRVRTLNIVNGGCPRCGHDLAGRWG